MRIFKVAVLAIVAALFLGACASSGSYEDDQPRDRERSSSHRH